MKKYCLLIILLRKYIKDIRVNWNIDWASVLSAILIDVGQVPTKNWNEQNLLIKKEYILIVYKHLWNKLKSDMY